MDNMTIDAAEKSHQDRKVAWWHGHRRLYDWVIHFAGTPHGSTALFVLSFAESSFFPVPPDVLLAPLTLGAPRKWLRFALACSIASVLGGVLGYAIGAFLWSMIGSWALANSSGTRSRLNVSPVRGSVGQGQSAVPQGIPCPFSKGRTWARLNAP